MHSLIEVSHSDFISFRRAFDEGLYCDLDFGHAFYVYFEIQNRKDKLKYSQLINLNEFDAMTFIEENFNFT